MQDAAAALPARLLKPQPGERIADLCAAPGGKTAQLAAAGAEVLAVDRSAKRLERLEENLARLHLKAETRAVDAEKLDAEPFDAILLDAPCSATGTIRRHPDVAWTKGEEDIRKLAGLQTPPARQGGGPAEARRPARLLHLLARSRRRARRRPRPFSARHPGFRAPARSRLTEIGGLAECITPQGDLRTLPCHLDARRRQTAAGSTASSPRGLSASDRNE